MTRHINAVDTAKTQTTRSQSLRGSAGTWVLVSLGLITAAPPVAAQALDEWRPSRIHAAKLPEYCHASFGLAPANPNNPMAGCGWFNHFCPGLMSLEWASDFSLPRQVRQLHLTRANGHLAYTRKHITPSCPLEPQLRAAETRARILAPMLK